MLTAKETKLIAALQNRHQRKKAPVYMAEGLRVCREAITRIPGHIQLVLIMEGFAETQDAQPLLLQASRQHLRLETISSKLFRELTETESPQGILCIIRKPEFLTPTALPLPFALILDQVAEPGNLGTILRTAWAVGLTQIWLVKGGADPFAPKVVRSGMGAQFALSFSWFDSLKQARETLFQLGGKTLWVTEEKAPVSVFDEQDFLLPGSGIVFGNEANGISEPALGTPVTIPMPGKAESLNVAQAATVFLFEAVRRKWV